MSELYDKLKDYFENTPQEQLDKDWNDVKYLNDIGPDVILYAGYARHLKERYDDKLFMDIDKLNGMVKLSDGNIELKDLNPMDFCETEGEFLARQALLSGDKPNQYYISGCGIYRYKDIPEDELKWYHVADIYEIKIYLGHKFLRRFKVGKYRGEYICKIINEDFDYITWCLDNMRGFALTTFERKCYEYNLRLKDFNDN